MVISTGTSNLQQNKLITCTRQNPPIHPMHTAESADPQIRSAFKFNIFPTLILTSTFEYIFTRFGPPNANGSRNLYEINKLSLVEPPRARKTSFNFVFFLQTVVLGPQSLILVIFWGHFGSILVASRRIVGITCVSTFWLQLFTI